MKSALTLCSVEQRDRGPRHGIVENSRIERTEGTRVANRHSYASFHLAPSEISMTTYAFNLSIFFFSPYFPSLFACFISVLSTFCPGPGIFTLFAQLQIEIPRGRSRGHTNVLNWTSTIRCHDHRFWIILPAILFRSSLAKGHQREEKNLPSARYIAIPYVSRIYDTRCSLFFVSLV